MHILKKHETNSKGILVVTHKEIQYLKSVLSDLKKKYYIICHVGYNVPLPNDDFLSYIFCTKVKKRYSKHIEFTSRHFLNECFNNEENIEIINEKFHAVLKLYNISLSEKDQNNQHDRYFDFICVSRVCKNKNPIQSLLYLKQYCESTNANVCFILMYKENQDEPYYNHIIQIYNTMKHLNILFIDTRKLNIQNKISVGGIPPHHLSYFYKKSKVYLHTCVNEGESRTIHEAMCCGCKILAHKNTRGGAIDFINANNGKLYDSNNYLHMMKESIDTFDYNVYDIEFNKQFMEKYTIEKLLSFLYHSLPGFSETYEEFKQHCDCVNLTNKFPGHDLTVPWYIKGSPTSDIKTKIQLEIFMKSLNFCEMDTINTNP
tara:strand:+ start:210 stop:1331 length:1122 start_codon:yes stop_codon:yes gene_type:complete